MSDITKMNLIAIVQKLPNEDIEFIQTCITMLENKINNLQKEKDKYKNVIDKIKKIITSKNICIDTRKTDGSMDYVDLKQIILELLEEVE